MSSAKKGTQHKISGYKPPRVQITYDLEAEGGKVQQELPFVIGVMANFSGHLHKKTKKVKDQRFLEVNKENFNSVVESVSPKLQFSVPNKVKNDGSNMRLDLNFKTFEDFSPGKLVQNIPALRELFETRKKLLEMQVNVDTNEKFEETLIQLVKSPEALKKAAIKPEGSETSSEPAAEG